MIGIVVDVGMIILGEGKKIFQEEGMIVMMIVVDSGEESEVHHSEEIVMQMITVVVGVDPVVLFIADTEAQVTLPVVEDATMKEEVVEVMMTIVVDVVQIVG